MIFGCDADQDLLPHFIKHYKNLGVTQFYCVPYNTTFAGPKDIIVYDCPNDPTEVKDITMRDKYNQIIASVMSDDEWWFIADLDELQEYPKQISEIVEECNENQYNCVCGDFLDHVAVEGTPDIQPDIPLHEQYPIKLHITKHLGGDTNKVMMVKGKTPLHIGNHYILDRNRAYSYPLRGTVHHYKWNGNVVRRQKMLMEEYQRLNMPWINETKEFFKHFDGTFNYWLELES